MKIAKLLVLSALWLMTSSAMAAIVDGVRQKPAPAQTQGFVASETTDTYFYLYNVDAKAFFTEGNAWGTQVSIGDEGLKVAFTPDGAYELTYLFNDFSLAKNSWKLTFFDSETSMFVDLGSQPNYRWGVEQGDGTFRLFAASAENGNPGWTRTNEAGEEENVPAYREGQYMGYDATGTTTACVPYLTVGEGHCINWAFVTEEVYEAYKAEVIVYAAADKLKKAIEEAEAKGFTATADYKALYANEAATVAELEKAVSDLNAAFIEWGSNNASVENPADVTSKIVNAHFDNGDCTTGWSGDAFGRGGTVSDGAEHYSKNYDTYQTISGLNPGIYAIGVYGYYRSGNYNTAAEDHWLANDAASKYAKLYGKVGEAYYETPIVNVMSGAQAESQNQGDISVTYTDPETQEAKTVYVPNTMATADYFFHSLNQYANKLLVAVDESGELTIGVKKTSQISGDWSMFDDFSLSYYGAGSDAAKLFLDETLKNYSEMTIEEGTLYTESYLTAYNEALKQEISISSIDDVATALAGIEAAKKAIDQNIDLWKQWQDAVENAKNGYVFKAKYEGLAAMDDLADYCDDMNIEEIVGARALTNEELEAELAKIADMIQAVIDESLIAPHEDGDDMTDYIKNPGFDEDKDIDSGQAEGWTIDSGTGGNITRGPLGNGNKALMESALGYMNYCFEAWHRYNWDVWQEIENLPKGMYELSVQGYVRCEVSGYQRGNDINPDYPSPIYLYMNSATAQFPSVYSEDLPEGKEYTTVEDWTLETVNDKPYPNSMGGAAQCFGWGMYEMKAYGLIAQQGDKFRIGVKMEGNQDWWCIWDNFKLTYRKPTVEIVQPILEAEIEKINLSEAMGSEVYEQVAKAKEDAQAAIASGDGEQMFDALVAVYEATDAIRSSVVKFRELTTALENLAGTIPTGAIASIRDEAQALYDKINNGVEGHTIATSEVDDNVAEITKMMNRLGLPAGMDQASDANPVECTTAIINPAYVDGNDNGWTGGAAINAEATDAEKFNTNYNYYQVLQGMPAGTYQVKVQGYFRAGNATTDYTSYIEDPTANNNAFLYAVGENNDTCSVAMLRLASQTIAMEELSDGYVWASEADKLAVPNSMTTAGDMFMTINEATGKNYYADNTVTVKVGEDGRLTIGLKKKEQIADDWTIWSNWQLFYYGTSSSLQPNGDPSAINSVADELPAKVEFFNLNGARINKPTKGVAVMKQTLSDGKVKVTKVIIK